VKQKLLNIRFTSAVSGSLLLLLSVVWGCRPGETREIKIPPLPEPGASAYKASLAALTDAIDDEPRNSYYYYRRALLYTEANDHKAALNDINNAIEFRKTNEKYGRYYVLRGQLYLAAGKVDSAFQSAQQAEKLDVQSPDFYMLIGQLYTLRKEYDKAAVALDNAQKSTPFEPTTAYYLGMVAAGKGDTARGIELIKSVIPKRPEFKNTYSSLSQIYYGLKNYPEAKQYAHQGLTLDSNDAELNNHLGYIYKAVHRMDSAVIYFKKAVKLDTSLYSTNYELAMIHVKDKEFSRAIPYLEKLLPYQKQYPEVQQLLILSYAKAGREPEALAQYASAVQTDSTNAVAVEMYNLLKERYETRRKRKALDSVARAKARIFEIEAIPLDINTNQ
jgi:predicted Zn-dependent protease